MVAFNKFSDEELTSFVRSALFSAIKPYENWDEILENMEEEGGDLLKKYDALSEADKKIFNLWIEEVAEDQDAYDELIDEIGNMLNDEEETIESREELLSEYLASKVKILRDKKI